MTRLLTSVVTLMTFAYLLLLGFSAVADTRHIVHFENTDHELHVYEIKGQQPGKTMLIIGGMHNEPGGYVTADLFADVQLKKGNLIVVPRANMPAIVNNKRGINGDMNRTFSDIEQQNHAHIYEDDIVTVLKSLIAKSDVLLNLHDGYGFYRPQWQSEMENPKRWGQAIITDREQFSSDKTAGVLNMADKAKSVVAKVNQFIDNDKHRFHYKNTRTKDPDTIHKEQRRSATFYALYEHGIESYGVETSKNIRSLDLKVTYQSMIVNAFLDEFGIITENQTQKLAIPKLSYLLVSVNDSRPVAYRDGEIININSGDNLRIEEAFTNYERGVVVDLEHNNSLNDIGKTFQISQPTSIRVLKDQYLAGRIFIQTNLPEHSTNQVADSDNNKPEPAHLVVEVSGQLKTLGHGETLSIARSDTLKLVSYQGNFGQHRQTSDNLQVNFIGFVGNHSLNDGEDRGYLINQNQLIKRFSVDGKGKVYRIKAEQGKQLIAQFYISTDG